MNRWHRIVLLASLVAGDAFAAAGVDRCGWFQNPTPANAWLVDRDGTWMIGVQGGDSAEGDWPPFEPSQWVETNGSYGYGCACLRVVADRRTRVVREILSTKPLPLATCRADRSIEEPR